MIFRSLLNIEKRSSQSWEDILFNAFGYKTKSGQVITPEGAFDNLGAVFACVERRANALSKLPLQVFERTEDGRKRANKHNIDYLLTKRPNKYQTPSAFKKYIVVSQLLWGNAYILMEFDRKGKIIELIPLNPGSTTILKQNGEYWFHTNIDGKPYVFHEEEIIHLPYISSDGKIGKAPLTVARENAGNLQAMQEFEGNFYRNGTMTKGALKVPGELNKDAKRKIREEWRELYGGVQNTGDIAILDSGLEWQSISIPLKDAEFVTSKKLTIVEIANIFNVPSFLLNDMEKSTYNNIEHQNMRFILDVIQPDCIAIEEEFNYKLFTEKEREKYYVKFNLTSALRGDSESRVKFYKEMLAMGVYSINEVRELEDKNSIGEIGDKHYFSLNYTTLETLEKHQRIKGGDELDEGNEGKEGGQGD